MLAMWFYYPLIMMSTHILQSYDYVYMSRYNPTNNI